MRALARGLRAAELTDFQVAVVLGSGLGAFAERLANAREVPFREVEGMQGTRVAGHAGRFVLGTIGAVRVLVQEGRAHLYEGWSAHDVARSVRAFAETGCRAVLLTNAAGGLVPGWTPPCLMRIRDHVNWQAASALGRAERAHGSPYDADLGLALAAAASDVGVTLEEGVYAGMLGPAYETPAEIRALARIGVHAVGMSTVNEALAACAAGMRVGAVSCITNPAAGIAPHALDHAEVVAAGAEIAEDFTRLLAAAMLRLERLLAAS